MFGKREPISLKQLLGITGTADREDVLYNDAVASNAATNTGNKKEPKCVTSTSASKPKKRSFLDNSDSEDEVKVHIPRVIPVVVPSRVDSCPKPKRKRKKNFVDDSDDSDTEMTPFSLRATPVEPTLTTESPAPRLLDPWEPSHSSGATSQSSSSYTQNETIPLSQRRVLATPHPPPTSDSSLSQRRVPVAPQSNTNTSDITDDSSTRPSSSLARGILFTPLTLPGDTSRGMADSAVQLHLSRCLMPHQVTGVQWLWNKYVASKGCILADDMGLGKTVQVISLLSAILHKTGSYNHDVPENRRRRRGDTAPPAHPCLIVCPSSVLENWQNELDKWGFFLYEALGTARDVDASIDRARANRLDVLLCSYDKLKMYTAELAAVKWSVAVFDEGHTMKDSKSKTFLAAVAVSNVRSRLILSGTVVQNDLTDLWPLLFLTGACALDLKEFKAHFSMPIKRSIELKAKEHVKAEGALRKRELQGITGEYLLQRSKESEMGGELKGKKEVLVFCELSPLQKRLYRHCLALPDFENAKLSAAKCPCGSGAARRECCEEFIRPFSRESGSNAIDSRAVIWRQQHPTDQCCESNPRVTCPTCIILPCLQKLARIANHPCLLQGRSNIGWDAKNEKVVQFASEALSPALLEELGGVYQPTDFVRLSRPEASGKMMVLQSLLRKLTDKREKVLVFSESTKTLDLIELFVKSRWGYCRLDGALATDKRQSLINKYNNDANLLIFLLSTKAGGVGINLVSASKVIQYDVCWNPSSDMQSQDRSYRMGQKEEVTVYRLIAKGTIEEMIYMRQLYKLILSKVALSNFEGQGQFQGVQGDSSAHGELFGVANLFQYEEAGILDSLKAKYASELAPQSSAPVVKAELAGLDCMRHEDAASLVHVAKEDLVVEEVSPLPVESVMSPPPIRVAPPSQPAQTQGPPRVTVALPAERTLPVAFRSASGRLLPFANKAASVPIAPPKYEH